MVQETRMQNTARSVSPAGWRGESIDQREKVLLLTLRFVSGSRRVIPEVSGCSVCGGMEWAVVLGLQRTPLHLFRLRCLPISFNWRQLQFLYIWVRAELSRTTD